MEIVSILAIANQLLNLLVSAGVNVNRLMAMRELSEDGHLTAEQLQQLADERQAAIDKL